MTIREYATEHGVSYQSVHQLIKKKTAQEALSGHINRSGKVIELDDYAVEWITQRRSEQKQNIIVEASNNKIEALKAENDRLKDLLIEMSQKLEAAHEEDRILLERAIKAEAKLELLEQKEAAPQPEEPPKKTFWRRLFG